MKTITIGRDMNCDVSINNKMISRRHAILRIHPTGKMELVDMSTNGTYVNGIRLSSNVPFPLTRKDIVSFAHVSQLDWKLIPNPLKWVKLALMVLAAVAVAFAVIMMVRSCADENSYNEEEYVENGGSSSGDKNVQTDSLKNQNASSSSVGEQNAKDCNSSENYKTGAASDATQASSKSGKKDSVRISEESVLDKVMRNTPSARRRATEKPKDTKATDKNGESKKGHVNKKKESSKQQENGGTVPNQML